MKKFYDKTKVLRVLKNLEADPDSNTFEMKLSILESEAEHLIDKCQFTQLEALAAMRELNGHNLTKNT